MLFFSFDYKVFYVDEEYEGGSVGAADRCELQRHRQYGALIYEQFLI